jgi:DNA-binding HxlR family transcriptional regulator
LLIATDGEHGRYAVGMPPRVDLSAFTCSVARTLDVVGDKWTLLVLRDAFYGVRRFEDFARDLGVARNVLADRLGRLVEAGVLERRRYEDRPPRDEYRLTDKGRDLLPVVLAMMHWGDTWQSDDGGPVELVHETCGSVTHAVASCAVCGEELRPRELRVQPLPPVVAALTRDRRSADRTG